MSGRIISNAFLWKTFERYSVMGIQFLLQLLLARLLSPSDFGTVAILGIFMAFSNIFVQSGLSTAIVQKKEINEGEISAVFNFSFIIACIIYIILFFCAPLIAEFFSMPQLKTLLRIMSLTIFPFSFNSLQASLLRRNLKFKSLFISTCASLVLSGGISVVMAINGYGIWSLVFQQIIYSVSICITLFFFVRWLPKLNFKFKAIRTMLNYGSKVLATSLVNELFVEIRTIIIGRMYSSASLAFFIRGRSFPDSGTKSIINSLQAVLLPVLAKHQEDTTAQKRIVRKTIMLGSFITWPILGLICISAAPFISLCLTDKWLPCVIYIYIFSIYFASWPIETVNLQLSYANGKSGSVLIVETLRKIIDIVVLFTTMWLGVKWIALGAAVVSVVCLPLYMYPSHKKIDYGLIYQLRDVLPNLFITIISCAVAYSWSFCVNNNIVLLFLQGVTALCVYLFIAYLTKSQSLRYTLEYIKLYIKK